MSYARLGSEGSDVYVFEHVHGYLTCCGCSITTGQDPRFDNLVSLFEHLDEHRSVGHVVPDSVEVDVLADRDEGAFSEWDETDGDELADWLLRNRG